MSFPPDLEAFLPASTVRAWERIVPALPDVAYLAGGTGIAAHLLHRVSRDLDLFTTAPFDPLTVEDALGRAGRFARTHVDHGTLNGVFEDTKIQILDASTQRPVEAFIEVAGLRVAGLGDLLATKLKVLADRGELRDYFDIWQVEVAGGRSIEDGLGVLLARYGVDDQAVVPIVLALGSFDDVADDPMLPVERSVIEAWFRARQPEVVANLAGDGSSSGEGAGDRAAISRALRRSVAPGGDPGACGAWMPRAATTCGRPPGHRPPHRRADRS